MSIHCEPTDCPHPDTWFSRTLCAEPCGNMHTYCTTCGDCLDTCAHTVQLSGVAEIDDVNAAYRTFNNVCRQHLGIIAGEFLERWDRGDYDGVDSDDVEGLPEVIAALTFATRLHHKENLRDAVDRVLREDANMLRRLKGS